MQGLNLESRIPFYSVVLTRLGMPYSIIHLRQHRLVQIGKVNQIHLTARYEYLHKPYPLSKYCNVIQMTEYCHAYQITYQIYNSIISHSHNW